MKQRLSTLEREFEKGQKMLAEIEERRRDVRDTLLRISGAIEVLRELIAEQGAIPLGAQGD